MAQPWFKIYAGDYLSDSKVRLLTFERRGILHELWAFAWKDGGIPSDPAHLATLLGISAKAMRAHCEWIAGFFTPAPNDPTRLISPRMEIERQEAENRGAKAQANALQRWSSRNAPASVPAMRPHSDGNADDMLIRSQGQKELPPTPSGVGVPSAGADALVAPLVTKHKRRSRAQTIAAFPDSVRWLVNTLCEEWRSEDPCDSRKITINPEDFGQRVSEILAAHPEVSTEALLQAGRDYLASPRLRFKAPQFFFGPGFKNEAAPWLAYIRAAMTREQRPA